MEFVESVEVVPGFAVVIQLVVAAAKAVAVGLALETAVLEAALAFQEGVLKRALSAIHP